MMRTPRESAEGYIVESIQHGPFEQSVNEDGEWIITRDLLAEEFGEEPEVNTRSIGWSEIADKLEQTHKFRVYDDDGVLYYEGVCSTNECFGPLDWAAANAGATRIDYCQADGSWETL